jgi:hypothetical protein
MAVSHGKSPVARTIDRHFIVAENERQTSLFLTESFKQTAIVAASGDSLCNTEKNEFGAWLSVSNDLACYRCGASLAALSLPIARADECPDCSVQLHVCRMCVFYDPNVTKQCREDDAEEVKEKARPNFCDYFKPRGDAFTGHELTAESKAKTRLEALFGGAAGKNADGASEFGGPADPGLDAAEDLFK